MPPLRDVTTKYELLVERGSLILLAITGVLFFVYVVFGHVKL
jgi:hypothetical protein